MNTPSNIKNENLVFLKLLNLTVLLIGGNRKYGTVAKIKIRIKFISLLRMFLINDKFQKFILTNKQRNMYMDLNILTFRV